MWVIVSQSLFGTGERFGSTGKLWNRTTYSTLVLALILYYRLWWRALQSSKIGVAGNRTHLVSDAFLCGRNTQNRGTTYLVWRLGFYPGDLFRLMPVVPVVDKVLLVLWNYQWLRSEVSR